MAQEALDSIAREPGTRIALWNDIGGLHISEVPMVTDAADIAAIVQGQVVPEREAKQHSAQCTPADDAGFEWWPQA